MQFLSNVAKIKKEKKSGLLQVLLSINTSS